MWLVTLRRLIVWTLAGASALGFLTSCGPEDVHAPLKEGTTATVYSDHQVTILAITADALSNHWMVDVKVRNVGSTSILIGHWILRTKDERWIDPSSGQWTRDQYSNRDLEPWWLAHIAAMYFGPMQDLLRMERPNLETWILMVGMACTVLLVNELHKALRRSD